MAHGPACISEDCMRGVASSSVLQGLIWRPVSGTRVNSGEHLKEQPTACLSLFLRAVLYEKLKRSPTGSQVIHCCSN